MKTRSTVLTQEERDVLILAQEHPGEKHLSVACVQPETELL
jgi:hypothetical protein